MDLSERRAKAVATILVETYGVESKRVTAKGYGITKPVIQGRSAEANKANRRIEAHVTGVRQEALIK